MFNPRYTSPEDLILPNSGAVKCLSDYFSDIGKSKPNLPSLEDLFARINRETRNYKELRLDGLRHYINDELKEEEKKYFLENTIPNIVKYAIKYPKECKKLKLLKKSTKEIKVTLKREWICSILANSFFCTYNDAKRESVNIKKIIILCYLLFIYIIYIILIYI